jgi:hypothetical protein
MCSQAIINYDSSFDAQLYRTKLPSILTDKLMWWLTRWSLLNLSQLPTIILGLNWLSCCTALNDGWTDECTYIAHYSCRAFEINACELNSTPELSVLFSIKTVESKAPPLILHWGAILAICIRYFDTSDTSSIPYQCIKNIIK